KPRSGKSAIANARSPPGCRSVGRRRKIATSAATKSRKSVGRPCPASPAASAVRKNTKGNACELVGIHSEGRAPAVDPDQYRGDADRLVSTAGVRAEGRS